MKAIKLLFFCPIDTFICLNVLAMSAATTSGLHSIWICKKKIYLEAILVDLFFLFGHGAYCVTSVPCKPMIESGSCFLLLDHEDYLASPLKNHNNSILVLNI